MITYDVSTGDAEGGKRLRHIAKACLDYGVRVQYSVFECEVSPEQWVYLQERLLSIYKPEVDSLRFYNLGKHWRRRVTHHGARPAVDIFKETLIV